MNETINTTIKVANDTRRKLKLLAAILDKSMIEIIDLIVTEALQKAQAK